MTNLNICVDCGEDFFTEGEKLFYEQKKLKLPSKCSKCREKSKKNKRAIFEEISTKWNIEAKQEETSYFYNTTEAKELTDGNKYFVVGRKGTGKTAIAEYLSNSLHKSSYSEKLSFKNFPFNVLYALPNTKYTAPNQYITIWKYLIYSNICKMMINNDAIDPNIVSQLKKLYNTDTTKSLARLVENWTATGFNLNILGNGVGVQRKINESIEMSWIDKCDILEDLIREHLDLSAYYIIIDELDEDYREFETDEIKQTYLQLLTSLFKAVQDVRAIFKDEHHNIFPIIFLRTDIYALLKDSDKNKWSSFKVNLDWSLSNIKNMLAHRISIAYGDTSKLTFENTWAVLFSSDKVSMGNRQTKQMDTFEYITRSTQLRPRDYIQYLIECSKEVIDRNENKITPEIIKYVDDKFSDYLRDEITDEVHSVLPEIIEIFDLLSQLRKQTFSPSDFIKIFNEEHSNGNIVTKLKPENILKLLFEFSIIGNQPHKQSKTIFKYQNIGARFNFRENIMIHRGLYKALQIF
ncbi:MAG: hypothetical protein C0603_01250 [Denitrovibrio sp.]|nr:MAG: hypothetical protein C0603_01250 [Denitrovibrio sp.]